MLSGVAVAKEMATRTSQAAALLRWRRCRILLYSATDVIVAAAVKSLPAEQRRRVRPFLTGFNPTDKNADAHIRRMLELDLGLWQGIGEIFTRHDDLTALTYGDVPRANNEALARVYHLAAEFDLPVLSGTPTSLPSANVTRCTWRKSRSPLRNHPHVRFIGPMPGPAWRSIATRRN